MPITWGSDYSLLFIDNPVGTGFSFTDEGGYVTNQDMVGANLLNFTQQFLQVFPELRKAPLFIAGESYAGKYIPAFGHYIHNNKKDSMPINLKGLAIGDGWTDPPTMLHYSEFEQQIGLVTPERAEEIHKYEEQARKEWNDNRFEEYTMNAEQVLMNALSIDTINVYNYIQDDMDRSYYVGFLNKPEVKAALHTNISFIEINRKVSVKLEDDMYRTVKPWLEELLEHYGVLCYNGQLDVIVGYALSLNTYRSLNWSGTQGYLSAERMPIMDAEQQYRVNSYLRQYGNFWEAMVRGAGHMVPADQPVAAKQLIDLFIKNFK